MGDVDADGVQGLALDDLSGTRGNVTFDASTKMPGLTAFNLSFNNTDDVLSLNWQGMRFATGRGCDSGCRLVPEPASVVVLGVGLLGAGLLARRKTGRGAAAA